VRLASTTEVKLASLIRRSRPSLVTPALETSTSTGPSSASTAAKAASTEAVEVTSHCTAKKPSGGGDEW
jgi:hypothetical protein